MFAVQEEVPVKRIVSGGGDALQVRLDVSEIVVTVANDLVKSSDLLVRCLSNIGPELADGRDIDAHR